MWSHTACGIETRLVASLLGAYGSSHVISYRLRYWNSTTSSVWLTRAGHMWSHTACGIETRIRYLRSHSLHVTCDLIPLAYWNGIHLLLIPFPHIRHMWSHTACGIETCLLLIHMANVRSHMWSHTACGIETRLSILATSMSTSSHVISYRLRYWNFIAEINLRSLAPGHMWSHTACGIETSDGNGGICHRYRVTCDLIPLAVLKPGQRKLGGRYARCYMWSHTACGIETTDDNGGKNDDTLRRMWPHTLT